jgi:Rod binding domain-containing protein
MSSQKLTPVGNGLTVPSIPLPTPATAIATTASSLPPEKVAKLAQAAKDFEAMALGQLLAPMFDTVDMAHSVFGGGNAEATWRPMLVDAIGKQIAAHGGLGIAAPALAAMLRMQEISP